MRRTTGHLTPGSFVRAVQQLDPTRPGLFKSGFILLQITAAGNTSLDTSRRSAMNIPDRFYAYFLILVPLLTLSPATSQAQQFGEVVIKHGELEDDQYLAGAQVDLYATVNGDVVVAGGQLNLEGDINADLLAAGGTVTVRGVIADDARLAGGDLRILGKIGDDLVAAGGRIHIGHIARVGGRAWLSGGEIRVDGHVVE